MVIPCHHLFCQHLFCSSVTLQLHSPITPVIHSFLSSLIPVHNYLLTCAAVKILWSSKKHQKLSFWWAMFLARVRKGKILRDNICYFKRRKVASRIPSLTALKSFPLLFFFPCPHYLPFTSCSSFCGKRGSRKRKS